MPAADDDGSISIEALGFFLTHNIMHDTICFGTGEFLDAGENFLIATLGGQGINQRVAVADEDARRHLARQESRLAIASDCRIVNRDI